jgi:glucosamine-6-phosphate deaminase
VLVEQYETALDAAARVVALIEAAAGARPDALLALPTGQTPLAVYRLLRKSGLGLPRVHVVNLDEHIGLPQTDERSYAAYVRRELSGSGIRRENLHLIDGAAAEPHDEAGRIEALIGELGGIDLAVTGLGLNGHVAFNEPGSPFPSPTRVVSLSPGTRQVNGGPFGGLAPPMTITLGLSTLTGSRAVAVLATGAHKAEVVARLVQDPVSPSLPASAFRLMHNATLVLDRAAAQQTSG